MSKLPVAGFVLAGGRSSRMGQDKALMKFGGCTLIERALAKLDAVCERVAIAGGAADLSGFGDVIPDAVPGCGPLGGIVAALGSSAYEWNIFVPVDVPLVKAEMLRQLGERCLESAAAAVVARVDGEAQPLCAGYRRRGFEGLRSALEMGDFKVMRAAHATGPVEFFEVERGEPDFLNVNTPEDFERAERYSSELGRPGSSGI